MKNTVFALTLTSILTSPTLFAVELIGQTQSKSPLNVVSEINGMIEQADIELGEKIISNTILATIKSQDFKLACCLFTSNLKS